jgi:HAD superfamily hydrolase (TIGR01509 family)
MGRLVALLFDVDGTLAETEEIHRRSFNAAFARAGLEWEWSPQLYGELLTVTGGKERIKYYLHTQRPEFVAPADLDAFIADLHAAKTGIYTRTVSTGGVPLRPGVKRLLQEARGAGLRLGIATTTTPANVTALLENSLAPDGERWFEVISAGSVVPDKKPAPDVYFHAMQAMDVKPGQCVAFEDSGNGVLSAKAAGLTTLVTVSQYTVDHDFDDADLVVDQLGEPDRPFRVLAGDAGDATYVSVDLLEALMARVT